MKLKKEICKMCITEWAKSHEYIGVNKWGIDDEMRWNDGKLVCMWNPGHIDTRRMPKFCKYKLEQMVLDETK